MGVLCRRCLKPPCRRAGYAPNRRMPERCRSPSANSSGCSSGSCTMSRISFFACAKPPMSSHRTLGMLGASTDDTAACLNAARPASKSDAPRRGGSVLGASPAPAPAPGPAPVAAGPAESADSRPASTPAAATRARRLAMLEPAALRATSTMTSLATASPWLPTPGATRACNTSARCSDEGAPINSCTSHP